MRKTRFRLSCGSLQGHVDGQVDRHEAPLTITFVPGATSEELSHSVCDAFTVTRVYHGLLHTHDESQASSKIWVVRRATHEGATKRSERPDGQRPLQQDISGPGPYRQISSPCTGRPVMERSRTRCSCCRSAASPATIASSAMTMSLRHIAASFATAPIMNPYALPPPQLVLLQRCQMSGWVRLELGR